MNKVGIIIIIIIIIIIYTIIYIIIIIIIIIIITMLDVHARGFWDRQQSAFFDVRVCYPNADSYRELSPKQIFQLHENKKKRQYSRRVLEVEQGTFTPLVFTSTGGMADECKRFHSRLAELLTLKKGDDYATTISWIRAKVSFAILRSTLLCLRGTRRKRRAANISDIDITSESAQARILVVTFLSVRIILDSFYYYYYFYFFFLIIFLRLFIIVISSVF